MAFEQITLRTRNGESYGPVDQNTLLQWHQQGRVPADGELIDAATGETQSVTAFLALRMTAPPPVLPYPQSPQAAAPSAMDHLIPAKNPQALIAYYCGVFGLACGIILGPIALIFGILGLRNYPKLGVGRTHAWVGIILGGLETLVSLGFLVGVILWNVPSHR